MLEKLLKLVIPAKVVEALNKKGVGLAIGCIGAVAAYLTANPPSEEAQAIAAAVSAVIAFLPRIGAKPAPQG